MSDGGDELTRLLHELRSGLLGIGAVAAAARALVDEAAPPDVDRLRRELDLVVRTVDALDATLTRARAVAKR